MSKVDLQKQNKKVSFVFVDLSLGRNTKQEFTFGGN